MPLNTQADILVAIQRSTTRQRITAHFEAMGCCVRSTGNGIHALAMALTQRPDIAVLSVGLPSANGLAVCRTLKEDAHLALSHVVMFARGEEAIQDCYDSGADTVLSPSCPLPVLTLHVQNGQRLVEALRRAESLHIETQMHEAELEQSRTYLETMTMQLTEMAAELQAQIFQQSEEEETHIYSAQMATLVQAATRLRHEINNPLFAITGNTESALKRLQVLSGLRVAGADEIIARLERVLRGAERISDIVTAFSHILTPATEDYLPGIPMLKFPE